MNQNIMAICKISDRKTLLEDIKIYAISHPFPFFETEKMTLNQRRLFFVPGHVQCLNWDPEPRGHKTEGW